jgi:magnesium chelatase family protein
LLDRIDIQIEVPAIAYRELSAKTAGTSSEAMREIVTTARQRQLDRFATSPTRRNAQMTSRELRKHCAIDPAGVELMRTAMSDLGLSARAHDKVLRVARTIADMDSAEAITVSHLSEAINYRMLDRNMWT